MGCVLAHLVHVLLLQDVNLFWGGNPSLSSLVWRVCNRWSHEWLVSAPRFLQPSLNAFTHWWRFAMEVCVSMRPSSALLITSAVISSKHFATLFIYLRCYSIPDFFVIWSCCQMAMHWVWSQAIITFLLSLEMRHSFPFSRRVVSWSSLCSVVRHCFAFAFIRWYDVIL